MKKATGWSLVVLALIFFVVAGANILGGIAKFSEGNASVNDLSYALFWFGILGIVFTYLGKKSLKAGRSRLGSLQSASPVCASNLEASLANANRAF